MSAAPVTLDTLTRWQRGALIAGGAGLVVCLLAGLLGYRQEVFRSYLVAFLIFSGVALGCLAVVMIQHLTGGMWGYILRRPLEAGTRTLPVVALLFVPLALGIDQIYIWANEAELKKHEHLAELVRAKALYLNTGFFLVRAVVYFAIWNLLMFLLNRWSRLQDTTRDPRLSDRLQAVSGPGLVLFAITVTFAAIDWIMSLEPGWYSTIFGGMVGMGQVLSGFAFCVAVLLLLGEHEPLKGVMAKGNLRDLGSLLLAFVMVWAYLGLSQYLLIWSGNLPEEIPWYQRRSEGVWKYVAISLILFHFALPFVLLLSADMKRNRKRLLGVVLLVLGMRMVDLYWLVVPGFKYAPGHTPGILTLLLSLAAVIGVGGVWLSVYLYQIRQAPLLPLYAPETEEVHPNHG